MQYSLIILIYLEEDGESIYTYAIVYVCIVYCKGDSRSIVVEHWTAGQQVEPLTLHLGHVSY